MTSCTVGEGELRRRLKRRVDLFGLTRVARELGIGREALARYGAEFDLHAGTRALIEARLTALDSGPSEPRKIVAPYGITRERESEMLSREQSPERRKERGRCSS